MPNSQLIQKCLPSARTPVHEAQAHFLALLIDDLGQAACKAFKVPSLDRCPDDGAPKFTALPAYDRFVQGAYACGFVMRDGKATHPMGRHAGRPMEAVHLIDFPTVRHLIHYILRAERHSFGYGSEIYTAMRSGLLPALADRLRRDSRFYQEN